MALFDNEKRTAKAPVKPRTSKNDGEIVYLTVDSLLPNPYQPRTDFPEAEMQELANSIREHGIVQPLTVAAISEQEGRYYIIAGERRKRGAEQIGLLKVPAIVRRVDSDQELAELALVENVQRQDLSDMDAARGYERLMQEFNLTQEQIAERTGKDRSSISKALKALKAPEVAKVAVEAGELQISVAAAMVGLSESDVKPIIDAVKNGELNRDGALQATQAAKVKSGAKKAAKAKGYAAKKIDQKSAMTGENVNGSHSKKRTGLASLVVEILPAPIQKNNKAAFGLVFGLLEECSPATLRQLGEAFIVFADGNA